MPSPALAALGLFGSATASSYVLFSNLGMSQYGIIPFLQGRVADVHLSPRDKLKTWVGYFQNAKFWSVTGGTANVVFGTLVAAAHPSVVVRRLGLGAAVPGLAALAFTFAFVQPTESQLYALDQRARLGEAMDEKRVDGLIERWAGLHHMRYVAYVSSWLLSVAAVALGGKLRGAGRRLPVPPG